MINVKTDINELIQNPQNVIIDLRDSQLFKQQHFKNTINIPLDDFDSQIPFLPFHKQIYLICETGKNAKMLALKLQKIGYQCYGVPYGFSLILEDTKKDGNAHLNV